MGRSLITTAESRGRGGRLVRDDEAIYTACTKTQTMSEKLKQDHFKVSAKDKEDSEQYLHGRGAQFNTKNKFLKDERTREHIEGIDDWSEDNTPTVYLEQE